MDQALKHFYGLKDGYNIRLKNCLQNILQI